MQNFKQVMELIALSILINENTEYCSFVEFAGHVEKVDIRVYKSKEQCIEQSDRLYKASLHYDPVKTEWKSEKRILVELEDAKKNLHGYLYGDIISNLEQQQSTRP